MDKLCVSNAPPRAIAFDLDGTLVDTMFAFAVLASDIMRTHYGDKPARARARYLETSGVPFRQQLEILHPLHQLNDEAAAQFECRKRPICEATPMEAPTIAALHKLRARGIKIVLSSNTGQEFLDDFTCREEFPFDLALGFDLATGLAKGNSHFERISGFFALRSADILFVGDSLTDGDLALRCNVRFVGRVGTFEKKEFEQRFPGSTTIEQIAELVGIVDHARRNRANQRSRAVLSAGEEGRR